MSLRPGPANLCFFEKCHAFLPIMSFEAQPDRTEQLRRTSSFLLTAVLAIGSRFYCKYTASRGEPLLQSDVAAAIARLAYAHLAASLFRKQHQLADVQATLLLGGWGLQAGGGGPDPWLVTGHCARLAHRLGLHRIGSASWIASTQSPEKRGAQWRTWMAWF